MSQENDNVNDYAAAKALNDSVNGIIILIAIADASGLPEDYEINELNRAYILLTTELQKLYDRNSKLATIEPKPIWYLFDVIKTSTWEINEHLNNPDNDFGNAHNARVEKLCIISGLETPNFSHEQKKIVDYAEKIIKDYAKILDDVNRENRAKKENDWHIPEYTIAYKPNGIISINNVLQLKKAHAGSATERLMEEALKNPNTLFKPDLRQTSRNLSTIVSGAGFSKVLRDLFFPTVSNDKGIVFRSTVTRDQADADKIDTTKLDLKLKKLGATTEPENTQ